MQDTVSYTVHSFLLTRRGEQQYIPENLSATTNALILSALCYWFGKETFHHYTDISEFYGTTWVDKILASNMNRLDELFLFFILLPIFLIDSFKKLHSASREIGTVFLGVHARPCHGPKCLLHSIFALGHN